MSTPQQGIDITADDDIAAGEDAGQQVQLRDPKTDAPLTYGADEKPIWIRVAGTLSNVHRKALAARVNRTQKRRALTLTYEEAEAQGVELVADCVLDWDGFFDAAGKPVRCTREAVVKVLTKRRWILAQVQAAQGDHAAFFGKPSPA